MAFLISTSIHVPNFVRTLSCAMYMKNYKMHRSTLEWNSKHLMIGGRETVYFVSRESQCSQFFLKWIEIQGKQN